MQTQNRHPLPPNVRALFDAMNPGSPLALAALREAVEQMHHDSTTRELEESESATTQGEIAGEWAEAARRLAAEIVRRDPVNGPATVEALAGNVMDGTDTEDDAACPTCLGASTVANTCDECGDRHCPTCDPCGPEGDPNADLDEDEDQEEAL